MGWGENAWATAEDLDNFLVEWFNESMYNRRDQLCGGPDETSNGMGMWRRLYLELEGGSELVEYGGRTGFNKYPMCTKVAEIHQHLDDWVDCLLKYDKDLVGMKRERFSSMLR